MDLRFSPEQQELGAVVRSVLARHWPEAEVRRHLEEGPGWDRALWQRLAVEVGVQGLAVPERFGGVGVGVTELGVVFEELGRALVAGPFLASVALAVPALLATCDEAACARFLPALAAGETAASLALVEEGGAWTLDGVATTAALQDDGEWVLTGVKEHVLDGASVDLLLVVARTPDGLSLFVVDTEQASASLVRTPRHTFDLTRRQAQVVLDRTPAVLVGQQGGAADAVQSALDTATVLLSAEQVGVAAWCLDAAVSYAQVREQFGRPIGSFQAVKHTCADMLLQLEGARSASAFALWAADAQPAELGHAASVAKAYCSAAASFCAGRCLQVHGGIGFTWEHMVHLYLKRAKSAESLLGLPSQHRERLARLAGF